MLYADTLAYTVTAQRDISKCDVPRGLENLLLNNLSINGFNAKLLTLHDLSINFQFIDKIIAKLLLINYFHW